MKKRLVALALCLVMVAGLIPTVLAGSPETDVPNTYTLTLKSVGEKDHVIENIPGGKDYQLPAYSSVKSQADWKTEKTFNYWVDESGTPFKDQWTIRNVSSNITLTAVYKEDVKPRCCITYVDATGVKAYAYVDEGESITLKLKANETAQIGGTLLVDESSYTVQMDCDLNVAFRGMVPAIGWNYDSGKKEFTPVWENPAALVKVTFYCYTHSQIETIEVPRGTVLSIDPNGGVYPGFPAGEGVDMTLVTGAPYTVENATRTGYRFSGWYVTEEKAAGKYNFKAVWEAAYNTTYDIYYYDYTDSRNEYYRFDAGTYIVLDPNGGTAKLNNTSFSSQKSFYIYNDYTLSDAVRTGYTFYGWYLTKSGSTYTFTAMWSKDSSTYDVYYYDYTDSKYEYYRFTAGTYLVFDPNGGTAKLNNTSFSSQKGFYIYNDYTLSDAVRTGYTFYGWYLTKSGSTYTFTAMWSKSASDVPYMLNGEDHYAYIKGYPNGSFKPNATITRAETAAIFYRLLTDTTRKAYTTTYNSFKDVPAKAWYNTAVSTMAKLGIVTGDANGYFRPSDPITRAEIAAMIARCDGSYYGSSYTNFSDVKGHWAASYIARAYELGWINGYGTTYAPDKYITRAETVAILNRVLNRAPQNTSDLLSGRNTFSDVGAASWYYLDVEEAANSHTYTRKSSGYEYWNRLIADPSWL